MVVCCEWRWGGRVQGEEPWGCIARFRYAKSFNATKPPISCIFVPLVHFRVYIAHGYRMIKIDRVLNGNGGPLTYLENAVGGGRKTLEPDGAGKVVEEGYCRRRIQRRRTGIYLGVWM